jgi:hypothetical protein
MPRKLDETYAPEIGPFLCERSVRTRYETGRGALNGDLAAEGFHVMIAGGYLDATDQVSVRLTCKRAMGDPGDMEHGVWEDVKGGMPIDELYIVSDISNSLSIRIRREPAITVARRKQSYRRRNPWTWLESEDKFDYVMKTRYGLYKALSASRALRSC